MKKVKVDDKSKFMYALLLSVLILALAFLLGYKKMENKAASLKSQNAELVTRIESLKKYFDAEEQNKADTIEMTQGVQDILAEYKGDARYEDAVYEAFNLREASLDTLEFSAIGFEYPTAVKTISADTVQAAQIEGLDKEINFYQFNVSYSGKVLYEGLKGMAKQINEGDYNLAVGQMNYQIGDDGFIDGKTLVSFYFVDGANLPYSEPPVAKYQTGLSNLFGVSGTLPAEEEN